MLRSHRHRVRLRGRRRSYAVVKNPSSSAAVNSQHSSVDRPDRLRYIFTIPRQPRRVPVGVSVAYPPWNSLRRHLPREWLSVPERRQRKKICHLRPRSNVHVAGRSLTNSGSVRRPFPHPSTTIFASGVLIKNANVTSHMLAP